MMRINRLGLNPYGKFDHLELNLGKSGATIIYGENEKGKTTSYNALLEFIFGVEMHSKYRFNKKNVMIDAQIIRDGKELLLKRKTGRNKTLLLDGKPFGEEILDEFIDLEKSSYTNIFAMNHEILVDGGNSLINNHEANEIFVKSISGINSLNSSLNLLKEKKDILYKKTGKKQEIPLLIDEISNLNIELQNSILEPKNFNRIKESYINLKKDLKANMEILEQLISKKTKMERVKNNLPKFSKLNNLNSRLSELKEIPNLETKIVEKRKEIDKQINLINNLIADLKMRSDILDEKIIDIKIDEKILEFSDEIENFNKKLNRHENLIHQKKEFNDEIDDINSEINKNSTLYGEIKNSLTAIEYNSALDNIEKITQLNIQINEDENRLIEQNNRLKKYDELKNIDPKLIDNLKSLLQFVKKENIGNKAINEKEIELKNLKNDISFRFKNLNLTVHLKDLLDINLPTSSDIKEIIDQYKKIVDNDNYLNSSKIDINKKLQNLKNTEDLNNIPSNNDLYEKREIRNSLIKKVESDYESGEKISFNRIKETIQESDKVADLIILEHDSVVKKNQILDFENSLKNIETSLKRSLDNKEKLLKNINNLFRGIYLFTYKTILDSEDLLKTVLDIKAELNSYKMRKEVLESSLKNRDDLLNKLVKFINENQLEISIENDLDHMIILGENHLENLIIEKTDYENKISQKNLIIENIKLVEDKKNLRIHELNELKNRVLFLIDNLLDINNSKDLSISSIKKILEDINSVSKLKIDLQNKKDRVIKIDNEIDEIIKSSKEIANKLEVKLENPIDDFQIIINSLKANRENLIKKTGLLEEQESLNNQINSKSSEIKILKDNLNEILQSYKDFENIDEHELQIREKRDLFYSIEQIKDEIIENGNGLSFSEIKNEINQYDWDLIDANLNNIRDEIKKQEIERDELNKSFGIAENLYNEKIKAPYDKIEKLKIDIEDKKTQLENLVYEYKNIVYSIALMEKSLEIYKEKNRSKLFKYASEYFKILTDSSFSGITISYLNSDNGLVVGLKGEEQISCDAMSRGTADQLFFALRLAAIKIHLQDKKPIPIIFDDIFINFDELRVKNCINLLMDFAKETQIIIFTHHKRTLEIFNELNKKSGNRHNEVVLG